MTPESIDRESLELLVNKAQSGDAESFEVLYEYLYPKLYSYFSFRVDGEIVEDVLSDVFLRIVEKLGAYRSQKNASFMAWAFRIAHNLLVDYYRKVKEVFISDSEDESESFFEQIKDDQILPDAQLDKKITAKRIKTSLSQLKPLHKEILELKFLEDFTTKEISQILGKSEGNVRILQLRALNELRNHF